MKRIENREILQQVRKETSEKIEKSRCRILICAGTGCLAGGSGEIYEKMCELTAENPDVDVFFGPEIAHTEAEQKTGPVEVKKSGCHGFCEMGPLMRIEPMGILYTKVQLSDCEEIFYRTIERGDVIRLSYLNRMESNIRNRKRSRFIKSRQEMFSKTADISIRSIFRNT